MPGTALSPIALTGLFTLAGVALGKYIDVFGEARRWRRDQRVKAYAEYLAAADVLAAELGQDLQPESRGRCYDAFARLAQAGAAVDVYGDKDVAQAAQRLWNLVRDWMGDWEALVAMDDATWDTAAKEFRRLQLLMIDAARQKIGNEAFRVPTAESTPPTN